MLTAHLEDFHTQAQAFILCIHIESHINKQKFLQRNANFLNDYSFHFSSECSCNQAEQSLEKCLFVGADLQILDTFKTVLSEIGRDNTNKIHYFDYALETIENIQSPPAWSPYRFIGIDYLGPLVLVDREKQNSAHDLTRSEISNYLLNMTNGVLLHQNLSYRQIGPTNLEPANLRFQRIKPVLAALNPNLEFLVKDDFIEINFRKNSPKKISVVIPTRGKAIPKGNEYPLVARCLDSLRKQEVESSKIEIVVVYDIVESLEYLKLLQLMQNENFEIKLIPFDEKFNFSKKCNLGAKNTNGDVLIFLNDDVEFKDPFTLLEIAGAANLTEFGAVGIKLFYPNGSIQHAGIYVKEGNYGHAYMGRENAYGEFGDLEVSHEVMAVTGACVGIKNTLFKQIHGWDESLPSSYNDVNFCLQLGQLGKSNFILNNLFATHISSATRVSVTKQEEKDLIKKRYPGSQNEIFLRYASRLEYSGGSSAIQKLILRIRRVSLALTEKFNSKNHKK